MRYICIALIVAVQIAGCSKEENGPPSNGPISYTPAPTGYEKDGVGFDRVPDSRPFTPPDPNAKAATLPGTAAELAVAIAESGKGIALVRRDFWIATRDHRLLEVSMELPAGSQESPSGECLSIMLPDRRMMDLYLGEPLEYKSFRQKRQNEVVAFDSDGIQLTRSTQWPAMVGFTMHIQLGHADCIAESSGFAENADDALLMLRCLKTLKLKNQPPSDPIEALKFYGWNLTLEGDRLISATDSRNIATDQMLSLFTGNNSIKTLWVYTSGVTDAGIAHLTNLPELSYLSIRSKRVTGSGFKILAALPKLEGIECWSAGITDDGLSQLPEFPVITSLAFSDTRITDAGLKHVRRFPKLNDLDLTASEYGKRDVRIRGEGLKDLAGLTHLEKLKLDGHPITDENLATLTDLPKLSELRLNRTAITGKNLPNLASFTELDYIEFQESPVSDLAAFATIPKLRWLDANKTKVTDAAVQSLAPAKNLELLYLDETAITGAALDVLASLPKLETLSIRNTQVKPETLGKLAASTSLQSLSLSGPLITDAAAPHLAKLTRLKSLGLEGSAITIEGVKILRKALPDTTLYLPGR